MILIAFENLFGREYARCLDISESGDSQTPCNSVSCGDGFLAADERDLSPILHVECVEQVGPKGREPKSMLWKKHNRVLLSACVGLMWMSVFAAPPVATNVDGTKHTQAAASGEVETLYRRAQELFRAQQYDEAKRLFETVKQRAGDYRQTAFFLAEIARLKNPPSGEGGQGQTVTAGGGVSSSEAISRLIVEGRRALKEGNVEQARKHFVQAVSLDANNSEARRYLDQIERQQKTAELSPTTPRLDLPSNLPKDKSARHTEPQPAEPSKKVSVAQQVKRIFTRELEPADRTTQKTSVDVALVNPPARAGRQSAIAFDQPVVASVSKDGKPQVSGGRTEAREQQKPLSDMKPESKEPSKAKDVPKEVGAKNGQSALVAASEKVEKAALSESGKVNRPAGAPQAKTLSGTVSAEPGGKTSPVSASPMAQSSLGTPAIEAVVLNNSVAGSEIAQAEGSKTDKDVVGAPKAEATSKDSKEKDPKASDKKQKGSDAAAKSNTKASSASEPASGKSDAPTKDAEQGSTKSADPKVEADTLVREAQQLMKQGKRDEAKSVVEKALQKDPTNVEAKALARDLEAKQAAQSKTVEPKGEKPVVLPPLGAAQKSAESAEPPTKQGKAEQAKKEALTPARAVEKAAVEKAPEVKKEAPKTTIEAAKETKEEKKGEKAEVVARKEATVSKATAVAQGERRPPARPVPSQAESEKADQAEAAFQKGLAAYQDGQLDVAVQWWNYALTLVPNHPRALQYLQQTRPEYDAWVQKQQANAIELQRDASTNAKLDTPITFDTAGPKSLTEFLSALSLITDISFYIADGVDPEVRITAKFEDVPLRDALDTTLLPIGLKWSQSGEVIAVTPDLKTKFFNLTPDQVARLKTLLESKTLQKILYGPEGVPAVKNVELLLDDRENVLLVTDSQENINKVEAFLKDMQQAGPPALIYKSWKIRPEEGPKIKALVEAIVRVQSDAPYDLERKVVVDGSDLIVKDTPENIKKIEELLLDKNFIKKIENQQLQVATFNLTPREPLSDNIEQVREMAQNIVTVVKTLLYAKSSESAAAAEGRRYWYDPNTLQLTIVDYPDNLRIVSDYIRSLPTLGKKQKSEIIFLKHQTASEMSDLISRVLGLTTQEPTAGAGGRAGGNQITRTVSVSGGTPQEIVFRDLRMRASKVNENDANDRNDDSIELIINTPTTSEERTIDEYKSEFVDDYEISVLEVRPSGTTGQGTAKIQIRYNPAATGLAGGAGGAATVPGLAPGGVLPGQVTPTPSPEAPTGLTVETIDNMNALLIRYDDPADFAEIKSYIEQLDIPVLQVSIETKLVEVNETKAKEYMPQFSILNLGKQGIDFDNSSLNMRYAQDIDEYRSVFDPFVEGPGSAGLLKGTTVLNFISPGETPVAFTLRMLEAEGVVNVVNGPMITVENGETADFQIEQRLGITPFGSTLGGGATTTGGTTTGGTTTGGTTTGGTTTGGTTSNQTTSSGGGYSIPTVTMSVSPQITQLGEIRLEISNLELFDVGGVGGYATSQTDANGNPLGTAIGTDPGAFDLRRRYLTTTARVTDGGTIVLGGWTGERSRKSESGVPILRNIPYVGKLFFNRTSNVTDKTTLLVFLTCHLQKP